MESYPYPFTVYIHDLLCTHERLVFGCYWKSHFLGALCYIDDLALLTLCASALHLMLQECEAFVKLYGLKFNTSKTQLIHFGLCKSSFGGDSFEFCGQVFHFWILLCI